LSSVSSSQIRKTVLGVLLGLAVLFAGAGLGMAEDLKAPDFTLQDLDGNELTLYQFVEKGPVVVSFWATWCKPCLRELPHLQELYDEYKEKGVSMLAISVDSPRSVSKVKSFINGHEYTLTVLLDPNKDVSRKFNAHLFPYTFVINGEGNIVYKSYGYRPGDEKKVEKELDALLQEQSPLYNMETESEGE